MQSQVLALPLEPEDGRSATRVSTKENVVIWFFASTAPCLSEPWTKTCGRSLEPVQSIVWSWHRLQQHAHDQGVLVGQWQYSVHLNVHGRQWNPVKPAPPWNPIRNTFICLLNQTININNCNWQLKVTYNLVSNFLCRLKHHLISFLGVTHFPLHMSSDGKWHIGHVSSDGRWHIC